MTLDKLKILRYTKKHNTSIPFVSFVFLFCVIIQISNENCKNESKYPMFA